MIGLRIRDEVAADIAAIEAVTIAAFRDAAHTLHTEQFIVDALRRSGQLSVSLVAEHDGVVVGHVAMSPVTISGGASDWYGLGPVSVAPGYQRQGVGSRLVDDALAALRRRSAGGCVVLGDPRYYARFGFRPEPSLVLPQVPAEYFQALAIAGMLAAGTVAYDASFAASG